MKNAIPAALSILIMLLCASAAADDLVRVEVLVFKHQGGQSDRWPASQLSDFSALIDPRTQALLADWSARPLSPEEQASRSAAPDSPSEVETRVFGDAVSMPLEPEADRLAEQPPSLTAYSQESSGPAWPELFVHDDTLSATMQRALGRLRSSAGHQVLSVTTWLQPLSRQAASPSVRVRDDSPLSVAWLQSPSVEFQLENGVLGPALLPEARYRLDGSVRVRQRQFRHVDLDLIWSDPVASAHPETGLEAAAFELHRLRQSRPIQLGRLEYFDSAWLGVLILVETWERPVAAEAGGP